LLGADVKKVLGKNMTSILKLKHFDARDYVVGFTHDLNVCKHK